MPLKNHVVQALSGKSDSLVVFLHGYGADGADLLNLADSLKIHLPNTIFMSPDAPNKSTMNPFGYEWFPIPRLDGSSLENAKKGRDEATKELNLFLNEINENTGIPFERIFLFGFSQGCMMSLHLAPRKNKKIAGVIGIAGMLMQPELLEKEAVQKPPILLVHGDEDDV
ncbi:alpha/beta hydrolase, partial [Amylibacter sp.]|nr:alpha/beta hydrolase [Amylibacter sp.]